jgi:hypothetical protein
LFFSKENYKENNLEPEKNGNKLLKTILILYNQKLLCFYSTNLINTSQTKNAHRSGLEAF